MVPGNRKQLTMLCSALKNFLSLCDSCGGHDSLPPHKQEWACSFVIHFVVCMTATAISNSYVSYVRTACLHFCKDTVVNLMSNVQLLDFGHWKTKGALWLEVACGMLVSRLTWRIPSFSPVQNFFLSRRFKMIHGRLTLFKLTCFSVGQSKLI